VSPAILLLLPFIPCLQDEKATPVERLGSPDAAVRRAAERELAESGAAAVPSLKRALARETDPIEPRVDALVKKLAAASWKEREEAGRALVLLGRAARPRLQTHENAADVEVAWRVKAILAELKELEPGEAAAAAWRDAAVCRLLGAAGDGGSAGLILGALGSAEGAPAEAALDLRLSVLGALADLRASITAEQAERATEEGLKLVAEPRNRRTMGAALKSLGRLKSPSAVKPLAALVENVSVKDLHVKRGALAALAALGTRESMRPVIDAFKSADPYLREAAWQVLQGSGFNPPYDPESGPASDDARARILKAWELQLSGQR
jgi:hypothetical protein